MPQERDSRVDARLRRALLLLLQADHAPRLEEKLRLVRDAEEATRLALGQIAARRAKLERPRKETRP